MTKFHYETHCENHSGGPASPHTVDCFHIVIEKFGVEREQTELAYQHSALPIDDPVLGGTLALWQIARNLAVIADRLPAVGEDKKCRKSFDDCDCPTCAAVDAALGGDE